MCVYVCIFICTWTRPCAYRSMSVMGGNNLGCHYSLGIVSHVLLWVSLLIAETWVLNSHSTLSSESYSLRSWYFWCQMCVRCLDQQPISPLLAPAESAMTHFYSTTQKLHQDPTGEGLKPTILPLQKQGKGWVSYMSEQPRHIEQIARVAGITDYYCCLLCKIQMNSRWKSTWVGSRKIWTQEAPFLWTYGIYTTCLAMDTSNPTAFQAL